MASRIVVGTPVVRWTEARLSHRFRDPGAFGIGLERDGALVAGVVFDQRLHHDVHAHIAADHGALTSRRYLYAIHHYPFFMLGVRRISVCVRAGNHASAKLATDLGFALEGVKRAGYADGEDMLQLGMLKEDCRWLHSRFTPTAAGSTTKPTAPA